MKIPNKPKRRKSQRTMQMDTVTDKLKPDGTIKTVPSDSIEHYPTGEKFVPEVYDATNLSKDLDEKPQNPTEPPIAPPGSLLRRKNYLWDE
mgnify:CR=1 FL=1